MLKIKLKDYLRREIVYSVNPVNKKYFPIEESEIIFLIIKNNIFKMFIFANRLFYSN